MYGYNEQFRCNQAARSCDDMAGDLDDQVGKHRTLQGEVNTAWKGDGGYSLSQVVGMQATTIAVAAGSLRSAARTLRAAAEKEADR